MSSRPHRLDGVATSAWLEPGALRRPQWAREGRAWPGTILALHRNEGRDMIESPPILLVPGLLATPQLYASQLPMLWHHRGAWSGSPGRRTRRRIGPPRSRRCPPALRPPRPDLRAAAQHRRI